MGRHNHPVAFQDVERGTQPRHHGPAAGAYADMDPGASGSRVERTCAGIASSVRCHRVLATYVSDKLLHSNSQLVENGALACFPISSPVPAVCLASVVPQQPLKTPEKHAWNGPKICRATWWSTGCFGDGHDRLHKDCDFSP